MPKGCCLVGHPQYYQRVGFQNIPGLVHPGVPAEVFFALSFDGHFPQGSVAFHDAFSATGPRPRSGFASRGRRPHNHVSQRHLPASTPAPCRSFPFHPLSAAESGH